MKCSFQLTYKEFCDFYLKIRIYKIHSVEKYN